MSERATPMSEQSGATGHAKVAGTVCLIQAAALMAVAATYAAELLGLAGLRADDPSVASMALVLTALFAVLIAVVGVHWWRGRRWVKTPTIVWNLLLLPASITLVQANGWLIGGPIALLAVIAILAAWGSPSVDVEDVTDRP